MFIGEHGLPGGSDSKESAYSAGDLGSTPVLGRCPGGGHGNPLQCSCLENPWTEEPGGLQSMGRKESDMPEQLSTAQHTILLSAIVIQVL